MEKLISEIYRDEIRKTLANKKRDKAVFFDTNLKDCKIIMPLYHGDERGYFAEIYRDDLFSSKNFPKVSQENISKSSKGVVRGLHFQVGDSCQAKIVTALTGSVIDVVVDIRKNSPTYGKSTFVYLAPFDGKDLSTGAFLYVPRGFAHGFISLEDNTLFNYRVDRPYDYYSESGIYYNDKSLNIPWEEIYSMYGIEKPILSEKDEPIKEELKVKRKLLKDTTNYFIYDENFIDNLKIDYDNTIKDFPNLVLKK